MLTERGQLYGFDFGSRRDNRIEWPHSVVIVQTDKLNRLENYKLTIVVPVTSKKRESPTYVELQPGGESGLTLVSYAKCDQIYTLPKSELGALKGRVSKTELYQIGEAVGLVTGA
ncbi:MAG: type II toxin-antitoxin system PemK/MazF family toxin [Armatimonadetes bacterium]|nr:type II toxin-antitoxin system PemK/MazF family toxin [Armatimonadota bacterium]